VFFLRGGAFLFRGETARSFPDLNKAVELNPQDLPSLFLRGLAHVELNRAEAALADGDRMVRLAPRDFRGFTLKGHAYEKQERSEQAVAEFGSALSLAPQDADRFADRADAYLSLKNYAAAEQDVNDALRDIESGKITEVFGMGTAAVIAPVDKMGYDGKDYIVKNAPGPVAQHLFKALTDIQYGRVPDPYGWTYKIEVNGK